LHAERLQHVLRVTTIVLEPVAERASADYLKPIGSQTVLIDATVVRDVFEQNNSVGSYLTNPWQFCSVDDAFVAPRDFNQLTIGWYVNHSKAPNVRVTAEMAFVAMRDNQNGEELTSDYSTYSAHVEGFFDGWTNPA
jgi:hypothetical protein